ncbi:MAG: ATPase domain-containing protein [Candidatus Woesearchaeota archaeon]
MENAYSFELKGDELHLKLGGGIPKSSMVLIEGVNGIGKSIFAQRFTFGALQNGHSVSYISTELPIAGFLNQMDSLRYGIRQEFLSGQLKFISLFPAFGNITFEPHMVKNIVASEEIFKSDIIVIDCLNDLLVRSDMDLKSCFELVERLKKIVSLGRAVVLCVEPNLIDKRLLPLLEGTSDIFLYLEEVEQYGNKLNILHVKRFSGALGELEKQIIFRVRPGIGLIVEIAS